MGFNKRLISKSTIVKEYVEKKTLENLFSEDVIIFCGLKEFNFYKKFHLKNIFFKKSKISYSPFFNFKGLINPRGSPGDTCDFKRNVRDNWGSLPYQDLMQGYLNLR